MRVFFDNMDLPVLTVETLQRDPEAGGLALNGSRGPATRFSNFRIDPDAELSFDPPPEPEVSCEIWANAVWFNPTGCAMTQRAVTSETSRTQRTEGSPIRVLRLPASPPLSTHSAQLEFRIPCGALNAGVQVLAMSRQSDSVQ